ncbi:MAG: hypothetical protein MUF31_15240 [Akkermansiaceae bacterium]|jgi:hypothetical protein|nr:hypothetical protein [Akkermansiaceae bacterium]
MKVKRSNQLAILVLGVGLLQMLGHITGWKVLRGLGLASGISPYPKVFCAVEGYEGFTARFELEGIRDDGAVWRVPLDGERYARIRGPYNRRNVHGATLAFAPRLPGELREELLERALAPGSVLREELGVPADVRQLRVRITPRDGNDLGPWVFPEERPNGNLER